MNMHDLVQLTMVLYIFRIINSRRGVYFVYLYILKQFSIESVHRKHASVITAMTEIIDRYVSFSPRGIRCAAEFSA